MSIEKRESSSAAKRAHIEQLCAKLAEAQRNGTLRPVSPDAKPIQFELRVKSEASPCVTVETEPSILNTKKSNRR